MPHKPVCRRLSVTEATSLVYLAELFFQFDDLLAQVPLERLIVNQQQELPILHDLHFQFYALVLLTHHGIPTSFLLRRWNRKIVQRYLFWRLKLGRGKPFADARSGFSLPGQPDQSIAGKTWWRSARFFPKAFGLVRQTLIEWGGLFEAASFHGASPFRQRKAGAQPAFSSPITATDRAAISKVNASQRSLSVHLWTEAGGGGSHEIEKPMRPPIGRPLFETSSGFIT